MKTIRHSSALCESELNVLVLNVCFWSELKAVLRKSVRWIQLARGSRFPAQSRRCSIFPWGHSHAVVLYRGDSQRIHTRRTLPDPLRLLCTLYCRLGLPCTPRASWRPSEPRIRHSWSSAAPALSSSIPSLGKYQRNILIFLTANPLLGTERRTRILLFPTEIPTCL